MTQFSLAEQTVYFLASIALGAAFAVLYDLIRAVRMLVRYSRAHLFLSDILFFFLCGILTSLFALPFNKGDVRAFIVFGEAVGFLTYRLTLGSIFGRFYAVFARLLRRFIRKNCEKLKKIYDCLLKAGAFVLYNIVASVDGLRRTAVSGVKTLSADARAAREKKRRVRGEKECRRPPKATGRKRKTPAADRRGAASPDRPDSIKIYDIPLRGDDFGIKRNPHEHKELQTREKSEKTRQNRRKR